MKLTAQIAALHGAYWSFDRWYRAWWYIWPGALALMVCGWIYVDKSASWTPASSTGSWARPANQPVKTAAAPINFSNFVTSLSNCFANRETSIASCTGVISGSQVMGKQLAGVYTQRAFLQREKQPDLALADYNSALNVRSDFVDALNGRAWIHMTRHEYDAAFEDLNKAIDLQPPPTAAAVARYYRGYAFLRLTDYPRALTDLNEAQKLQPNNADIYLARGETEQAQDNSEAALRDFDEFSKLAPKDSRGLIWRSSVLEATGHIQEALAAMESALALEPGNETTRGERDRLRTLQDQHTPPK
jgi:tetratricopeptide (TPR) repeat protein